MELAHSKKVPPCMNSLDINNAQFFAFDISLD